MVSIKSFEKKGYSKEEATMILKKKDLLSPDLLYYLLNNKIEDVPAFFTELKKYSSRTPEFIFEQLPIFKSEREDLLTKRIQEYEKSEIQNSECEVCHQMTKAFVQMKQLRSGDEGATAIYYCTNCRRESRG